MIQFSSSTCRPQALHSKTHGDRLVPQRILSQKCYRLVHARPTWSVLVEEITGEENEVDVGVPSYLQYLAKGVDRVLPSDRVFFGVADMIVRREEDTETAADESRWYHCVLLVCIWPSACGRGASGSSPC